MFNQRFERFPDASAHFSQLISHFTYGDHLAEPDQGGKMPMDYLVMEDLTLNSPALLNDPISTDKVCQGVPQNMLKYGVMGEIPAGFIGTELRKKHLVHMFEECKQMATHQVSPFILINYKVLMSLILLGQCCVNRNLLWNPQWNQPQTVFIPISVG